MNDDLTRRLTRHVDDATPTTVPPFADVLERAARRRRERRAVLAAGSLAAVVVTAVAIGSWVGSPEGPSPAAPDGAASDAAPSDPAPHDPAPTERDRDLPTYEWSNDPSPVVLLLPGGDVELDPWTSCWSGPPDADGTAAGMCADGAPGDPSTMEHLDGAGVDFWFGMPGWEFDATFRELGRDCPRSSTVTAEPTGDHTFHLDPAGPAGRYQVDLFGRGKQGDVITSLVWTTPTDGPVEEPEGTMALVSDDGDDLMAYQLEVSVQDLGFQPDRATVDVTATAANGESMSLDAALEDGRCYEQGSLFFTGAQAQAAAASRLGPAPYTYRVVLTLDGDEYVGTAVWPRDETRDQAPYTRLTFVPPLPAYRG